MSTIAVGFEGNHAPSMDELSRRFLGFMARHFVAYAFDYESFNEDGSIHHRGTSFTSGFVIELHSHWFWVTAGHCIKELNENLDLESQNRIRIFNRGFIDWLGWEAKYQQVVPFTYSADLPFAIDDRENGLDYGVIKLDDNKRSLFVSNGVTPITPDNWAMVNDLDFRLFKVMGIPVSEDNNHRLYMGNLHRIGIADIDAEVLEQAPSDKFFIGRLDDGVDFPTMKGVSGGPIFGFRQLENERWAYHIVALQSRWIEQQRVLFGCSLPTFASELNQVVGNVLREIAEEQASDESEPSPLQ